MQCSSPQSIPPRTSSSPRSAQAGENTWSWVLMMDMYVHTHTILPKVLKLIIYTTNFP